MSEIVTADIGGTNARFAVATIADGAVLELSEPVTLPVRDHDSLGSAWRAFQERHGRPLPKQAALALACPVQGEVLTMANSPWIITRATLPDELGVEEPLLVNDFEAVAHAVASLDASCLPHLSGPDRPLPSEGTIVAIGPGTGLGTASIIRRDGRVLVCGAEGGHIGFAPFDAFEDRLLDKLRAVHGRVSAERVISGPGIIPICASLAEERGDSLHGLDDRQIWTLALEGHDRLAVEGMTRFCRALGAFAGDMALAHCASGVVIAGGLGKRLMNVLPSSDFAERFVAKGRFETMLRRIPVRMIRYPEPGLFGAASALARRLDEAAQAT
ncbi:glucokinase [Acetobacter nitrogenifigens DSM 23921 = NBRC 105050]|uniref:Glucokinase n=1 Tax=Acetobacter nitrogenifigens DSM 23921 = NBRC 105050 TaxID=1120919 RepID=A0A511X7S8_9PROT|nr:glucokinase [Acetobacter nitrogenifigens]GBQ95950.1 glucokinase [Acetobacter nitrogenifigens DSM 23921 = NBRC 105050]GEN59003.1 glucokinase [Acetobacter nitrogenifigens DSM 23921 = NBRC 105050]